MSDDGSSGGDLPPVLSPMPRSTRPPPSRPLSAAMLFASLLVVAAALLAEGTTLGLQVLLVTVGVPALLGGAYLLWQVDPAYVLSLGVFLSPFSGNWQHLHFPSGVDPDRLLLSFGILQVLLRAPKMRARPPFRWTLAHTFMALAVVYVTISAFFAHTLFSKDPLFKLIDSFGVLPFLIFLVAPVAFHTRRQRSVLLATLVLMGLYLGLTTVFETAHINALVFPRYILNPRIGYHFGRGRGPFLDAVANGFALAVCGLACAVARMSSSDRRKRAGATAVGLLCLVGAFMSLERSVWLGAGLGVIVMLVVTRDLRRYLLPTVALGAVGIVAALALIPSLSQSVSSRATEVNPIWDRENLTTAGLRMFMVRPLTGFGWQTFQTKSQLYFQQNQNYPLTASTFVVHNFLLGYAVELGAFGLLLWVSAILLGVGGALATRGPPDLDMWHAGLIGLSVMFLVVANSIPPSEFPNLSLWLWAGVLFSGRYDRSTTALKRAKAPRTVPPGPAWRVRSQRSSVVAAVGASPPPAERGSLAAGLSFGAASFVGTTVVTLFTSIFIARLYGIHVVGAFALVYAPVAAVSLLSTVREQPALQRQVAVLPPRHPRVTGLFLAVFGFSSALTALITAIAVVVVYFVFNGPVHHPSLFMPAAVSLIGYALFTNTCMNLDSIFAAFRDGRQLFVLRLHQAVLYLLLVVVGRLISASVWSLVVTMILSWALPCLHRLIAIRRWVAFRVPRYELVAGLTALPEMLRFGLKLTPTGLLWGASDQIATWVLGSMSTVAAVGAYNRAWSLGQRFLEARLRLTELLFPALVERRQIGDNAGFDRALIDSLRYAAAFLLMFAAVGGGAARGVMAVFGKPFMTASTALVFLLLVPAFTTMVFLVSQALIADDRALRITVSAVVRLITTLSAVILLTARFGITGAAAGMAAGAVAQLVCQCVVVQRELLRLVPTWWPIRQMLGQVAAYGAAFAAAHEVLAAIPGYGGLLAALVAGVIVYVLSLVILGGLLPRDRARLHQAASRIRHTQQSPSGSPMPAPDPHPGVPVRFFP